MDLIQRCWFCDYPMVIRPNIVYIVNVISTFMLNPGQVY